MQWITSDRHDFGAINFIYIHCDFIELIMEKAAKNAAVHFFLLKFITYSTDCNNDENSRRRLQKEKIQLPKSDQATPIWPATPVLYTVGL